MIMKTELRKLKTLNPKEIIDFVDSEYTELKGLCFYDKENKRLSSRNLSKCSFYFDPLHLVLEVTIYVK